MILPGWQCPKCHGFNGEAKEELTRCRSCDSVKPIGTISLEHVIKIAEHRAAGNLFCLHPECVGCKLAIFILQQTAPTS
jgi:hypothetical protein